MAHFEQARDFSRRIFAAQQLQPKNSAQFILKQSVVAGFECRDPLFERSSEMAIRIRERKREPFAIENQSRRFLLETQGRFEELLVRPWIERAVSRQQNLRRSPVGAAQLPNGSRELRE